jgi:putative ABC transport system permease protein
MNALVFAWRGLVRQPARTVLAILGIAAIGALLFDMLMLSNGLVLSMADLLDRTGFDMRVSAGSSFPGAGARISSASTAAAALATLPEIEAAVPVRLGEGEVLWPGQRPLWISLVGAEASTRRVWTMTEGRDLSAGGSGEILVNRNLADKLRWHAGTSLSLRGLCEVGLSAAPAVVLRVTGVADFPFDSTEQMTAATTLRDFDRACGGNGRDVADQIFIAASAAGSDAARAAIERVRPDLQTQTNAQVVAKLQGGLSYFRQISFVLVTVTIFFALLLVTVLLTVSVNQRLGEIAALRALGFSQRRVVADVLCESALLVGTGGILALPLGLLLAQGLDWILKGIQVPADLHFFVYQHRALGIHAALFGATAFLAAAYPMWIVARLPIAATLRREVVS